jgi:hypothetical protein
MGQLTDTWRKQAGMVPSSGQYAAFNTVIFMGLLFIQFGLGMQINLFVGITGHHAGAGAGPCWPPLPGCRSWPGSPHAEARKAHIAQGCGRYSSHESSHGIPGRARGIRHSK